MAGRRIKPLIDATVGSLTLGAFGLFKRTSRERMANAAGHLARVIGPKLKEHRLGRENLRAAYPEKSDAEIEQILAGVWDNLARLVVEFAHLDEFHLGSSNMVASPELMARYERIRESGKPIIAFAAHLANWELIALAVKQLGIKSAVLYRPPSIPVVRDTIIKLRGPLMGELLPNTLDAPLRMARLLQSGVSVGMLADQHYTRGVEVMFFRRRCLVNPLPALLARQTGCAIRGVRAIRLPDRNAFSGDVTEEIEPGRAADGSIDIQGTMQKITDVIEGWVREHPEQWLWVHRRWRDDVASPRK